MKALEEETALATDAQEELTAVSLDHSLVFESYRFLYPTYPWSVCSDSKLFYHAVTNSNFKEIPDFLKLCSTIQMFCALKVILCYKIQLRVIKQLCRFWG